MKRLSILGSTGSIGKSTLRVVDHLSQEFQVVAIAGHSNVDLLEQQARTYCPQIVAVADKLAAQRLASRLPETRVVGGQEGVCEAASWPGADITISAITGMAALMPTLAAIESGKDVALASKEVLVAAGKLVMTLARQRGVNVLPVDSEHSALFQCLRGEDLREVNRLILTASGGPFKNWTADQLKQASASDALSHPTWDMGPKITIDSSTLMNKGLEVIEAYWLFDIPVERIEVVVHPQSIVHSLVEFVDGSLVAQVGEPDMAVPIQFALTYPRRLPGVMKPFDFTAHPRLDFYKPDTVKFKCLDLAFEALKQGHTCYLNAANEVLVERFLQQEIQWLDIGLRLEKLLEKHRERVPSTLEEILAVDQRGRQEARAV